MFRTLCFLEGSTIFKLFLPGSRKSIGLCSIAVVIGVARLSLHVDELQAADQALPLIEFVIKPNLCILSEGEKSCEDTLQLKWHSDAPRSLCLYQSGEQFPMKCWENEYGGEHNVLISASHNIDFQLRQKDENELIVQREFQVMQDNVKYRYRRRNAWSFF